MEELEKNTNDSPADPVDIAGNDQGCPQLHQPPGSGTRDENRDETGNLPQEGNAESDIESSEDAYQDCDHARGSTVGMGPGLYMDFIEDIQDGINSYLVHLSERQRGVVYDKHDPAERLRWREVLKQLSASLVKTDANEDGECEQRDGSRVAGTDPSNDTGEATSCAPEESCRRAGANAWATNWGDSCGTGFGEDIDASVGPCAPSSGLHFEPPSAVDGRPRLSFSACFESGNLSLVMSDTPTNYTLFLDCDMNTQGYTQWFYFGVRGGRLGQSVHFRIPNMHKARLLFGEMGMRPVVWSEASGLGWQRGGDNVRFYSTDPRQTSSHASGRGTGRKQYTLSFSYTFKHSGDTVFFAYHYPYTYTYCRKFIAALESHPYSSKFIRKSTLTRSIGGLVCDLLEVGSDTDVDATQVAVPSSCKPLAVVTSRVHPGEPNASWMMHGFLKFLCSPAPVAQALRSACNWIIVPMLNPDGVVHGCYRCGLAGMDLNRQFLQPHKRLHPTIWHLKDRLKGLQVDLYLDFHGHSKKEGVFFYGGAFPPGDERNADIRLLPRLCCLGSEDFTMSRCSFSVQNCKLSTARLVAFLELGAARSYTVEASFSSNGRGTAIVDEGKQPTRILGVKEPSGGNDAIGGDEIEPSEQAPPFLADAGHPGGVEDNLAAFGGELSAASMQANIAVGDGITSNCLGIIAGYTPSARRPNSRHESENGDAEPTGQCIDFNENLDEDALSDVSSAARLLNKYSQCYATNNVAPLSAHSKESSGIGTSDSHSNDSCTPDDFTPAECPEESKCIASDPEPEQQYEPNLISTRCESQNFDPRRLSIVGVTIAVAVAAVWQLERPRADDVPCGGKWTDDFVADRWPHLHHARLTNSNARTELAKLLSGKIDDTAGSDNGSDSNPSADERPADELRKLHKKLLQKLRRRRPRQTYQEVPPPPAEEDVQYRIVVAFGKTLRIPIKRKNATSCINNKSAASSAVGPSGNIITAEIQSQPTGGNIITAEIQSQPTVVATKVSPTRLQSLADQGERQPRCKPEVSEPTGIGQSRRPSVDLTCEGRDVARPEASTSMGFATRHSNNELPYGECSPLPQTPARSASPIPNTNSKNTTVMIGLMRQFSSLGISCESLDDGEEQRGGETELANDSTASAAPCAQKQKYITQDDVRCGLAARASASSVQHGTNDVRCFLAVKSLTLDQQIDMLSTGNSPYTQACFAAQGDALFDDSAQGPKAADITRTETVLKRRLVPIAVDRRRDFGCAPRLATPAAVGLPRCHLTPPPVVERRPRRPGSALHRLKTASLNQSQPAALALFGGCQMDASFQSCDVVGARPGSTESARVEANRPVASTVSLHFLRAARSVAASHSQAEPATASDECCDNAIKERETSGREEAPTDDQISREMCGELQASGEEEITVALAEAFGASSASQTPITPRKPDFLRLHERLGATGWSVTAAVAGALGVHAGANDVNSDVTAMQEIGAEKTLASVPGLAAAEPVTDLVSNRISTSRSRFQRWQSWQQSLASQGGGSWTAAAPKARSGARGKSECTGASVFTRAAALQRAALPESEMQEICTLSGASYQVLHQDPLRPTSSTGRSGTVRLLPPAGRGRHKWTRTGQRPGSLAAQLSCQSPSPSDSA